MPQDDKGYFYYTVRTKEKSFDDWIRKQASDNDCSINTYVKMVLNKERKGFEVKVDERGISVQLDRLSKKRFD